MKLLAYCPNCKRVFLSTLCGSVSPGTTMKDCQESCPKCGGMAQTAAYAKNTMYIAGHEFHTVSDADTLKNVLQILQ